MKAFRFIAIAVALFWSCAVAASAEPISCSKKIESFDFVVDYSGSMMMHNAQLKKTKIEIAKEALQRVNAAIPALDYKGGLHTMTPNGVIIPQGLWDRNVMQSGIAKLRDNFSVFGRMTSMGDSIEKYEPFLSSMARDAALIVVTDGDNNRGSDLVAVAREVYNTQRNMIIHIISLADTKNGEETLRQIAALNPNSQLVNAVDLVTSDEAVENFVREVFCGEKEEVVIVLRGVNFAFNSYVLDEKAKGILDEALEVIKSTPNKRILLNGWTDSKGSDAYNRVLSQNRANAVKNYLSQQGIPVERMSSVGRGKSFKYDNSTEEGAYLNRRTEISFD